MKKLMALLLTIIMAAALLTGCGDPVFDDFENYLNVEMTEINANYDIIRAETGTWSEIEDYDQLAASLSEVLIPTVTDSLAKLEDVAPQTDEVKAIKDKCVATMQAYKEGFETVLAGLQEVDEDKLLVGSEKIEEALGLLDEYNAALEELAAEVGAQIEY